MLRIAVALAFTCVTTSALARDWTDTEVNAYFDIPASTELTGPKGAVSLACKYPPGSGINRCTASLETSDPFVCRVVATAILLGGFKFGLGPMTYTVTCTNTYVRGEYATKAGDMVHVVDGAQIYSKGIGF